jgi:hypothetical protein
MKKFLVVILLTTASFAAQTISTIAVSGSSATVTTATAHGLSLNQGVCLKSTLPGDSCGVVTAVGSSTQFTASLSTAVNACASSCGTAAAAPEVIIMPTSSPTQGFTTWNWLNWVTTQQPCPSSASSAWIVGEWKPGSYSGRESGAAKWIAHRALTHIGARVKHSDRDGGSPDSG